MSTSVKRNRLVMLLPAVLAAAAILMAVPGTASAAFECSAYVSHNAAVYENPNGTGFIKNKYIGEHVTGPEASYGPYWVAGTVSPWVEVWVSGYPHGWMDINEIQEANTCFNPW